MTNIPTVRAGIVAVSRDCFPKTLSAERCGAVLAEAGKLGVELYKASLIVENENDVRQTLAELREQEINALVVYLGNFGPEGPETLLAQKFGGPVMFIAAAEETGKNLIDGRGDAYCGMLNASYNIGLRGLKAYIPENPVGTAAECAQMIEGFLDIARVKIGISRLKIITFGPRPYDFLACNAPIKPLFDLGVEIQENSELDLFASYNAHANDPRIGKVETAMAEELGAGNKHPGVLKRLAQYEITLLDWAAANAGASEHYVFANKCWPAFQTQFGFVPCYVNSRLASRGMPVACETDIYGALSEYIITLATCMPPTLLDINNTVPADMFAENAKITDGYKPTDLFMGFHCGNTPSCHVENGEMRHQLIMKRSLEPEGEPDITRGTFEGTLKAGAITLFRLQATAGGQLRSYIAEGETLPINPASFGGIGVVAVKEMARFYRHVLIAKNYPHHAGVAFKHAGAALFEAMKLLGVEDIAYNQPAHLPYSTENPFYGVSE
ncbi:MAG: fucose isomerase [Clostridiales bacterium]|jgi:L-fucose isomerase-like protein|nr:fucose isomerase [Clostridiales bacterium]